MRISVEGGGVISVTDVPRTPAQRLTRFDPARHGDKVMANQVAGAERW